MSTQTQLRMPTFRRMSDREISNGYFHPSAASELERFFTPIKVINIQKPEGQDACGIEIQIDGLSSEAVFRAFYLNRGGMPRITNVGGSIIVRYESIWANRITEMNQSYTNQPAPIVAQSKFCWDIALFGPNGTERCGLVINTHNIRVSYRWLLKSTASLAEPKPCKSDTEVAYVWLPASGSAD